MRSSSTTISWPIARHHRTLGGEIEGNHVELLQRDVAPHVAFGPIRQREDAHRLALAEASVQQLPHLGPLAARLPAMARGAEGEHAFLGAGGFLVAARAAEGGIEAAGIERLA